MRGYTSKPIEMWEVDILPTRRVDELKYLRESVEEIRTTTKSEQIQSYLEKNFAVVFSLKICLESY